MAKGKRRQPNRPRQAAARPAPRQEQRQSASDLREAAERAAESEGVAEVAPADSGPAVADGAATEESLRAAIAEARTAQTAYEAAVRAVEAKRGELQAHEQRLNEAGDAASETQRALDDRERNLDERDAALGPREEAIEAREDQLEALAAEAEAGFLQRREEILGPVKQRIAELTAEWQAQESQLLTDWHTELESRRLEFLEQQSAMRAELSVEREALSDERLTLDRQRAELRRERQALEAELEVLAEYRQQLGEERAAILRAAQEEFAAEVARLEKANQRLLDRVGQLEPADEALQRLRIELGTDPVRALEQLEEVRAEARTLRTELDARPSATVLEDLTDARQRLGLLATEHAEAQRAQRELQRQLDYQSAQIADVERLQLTNDALQASIDAYRTEIEILQAQFQQLTTAASTESAFPECHKMDSDLRERKASEPAEITDLEEFIEDLQLRMANDRDAKREGKRLNYRDVDLRIFLAGLAMSRLHLLEGVSGTGKTTLPHAFANAVGGGVKKIEVQAGWRDKQDLLGYYNSFERVYRETPALQYLYRATLPAFNDRLIFIVLDEMNLSHPEQYFADFLSALEDPKAEPLISIVDRSVPGIPEAMKDEAGVQMPLPRNVWFVGTANQDETTFAFAPKTYDRAHVMELESDAPEVKGRAPKARGPVSYAQLTALFEESRKAHLSEATTAKQYVFDLGSFFTDRFRVGWGHRLDQHIERFVPVNKAAGGSLGEALDHIVATKVIKKIEGKHTLRRDSLDELAERIEKTWPDPHRKPIASLEAIEREIHDLDFG